MANRSVTVELRALVNSYIANIKQASVATKDLAGKVAQATIANQEHLNALGATSLKAGVAFGAATAAVTKAAMDWESAWAGVTKTVDGTAEELSALEGELRKMARTLPASHTEIAAVAEAAGQLGVKTEDVAGFTRTMIDLGQTTNLTADAAATSLAQFMNIMGTAAEDVGRLGATVVDLGNKGASTERDIVEMGQRIAAAGRMVGMSEQDVLAYASALASAGVEAEAGGTAISQTFRDIDKQVRLGAEGLDTIAQTAGVTSQQFSQAWKTDAAGAAQAFIEGLGRMSASGGDANAVLDDLGMTGIRQSDSLMRLAQAQGLLAENLDNSKAAWSDQTALMNEAEKRYETTASKVQVAWNNITDAAIEVGAEVLPVVQKLADGASTIAEFFGDMPGPVKAAGAQLLLVGTGGLLAAGGLMKAATAAAQFRTHAQAIAATPLGGRLTAVGKTAGVATVALMGLQMAGSAVQSGMDQSAATVTEMTNSLLNLGRAGGSLESAAPAITNLAGAFDQMAYSRDAWFADLGNKILAGLVGMSSATDTAAQKISVLDQALSQMSVEQSAAAFADLVPQMNASGLLADDIVRLMPSLTDQYRKQAQVLSEQTGNTDLLNLSNQQLVDWMGGKVPAAVRDAQAATAGATDGTEQYNEQLQKEAEAARDAEQELRDLIEALYGVRDANSELIASESDVEAAIDSARDAIEKKNLAQLKGKDINNLNNPTIREANDALRGIADSARNYSIELLNQGRSQEYADSQMQIAAAAIMDQAEKWGLSKDEVLEFTESVTGVPQSVLTKITVKGARQAEEFLKAVEDGVLEIPDDKVVSVSTAIATGSIKDVKAAIADLPDDQQFDVLTQLKDQGFKDADKALKKLTDKLAKKYDIDVDGKSAKQTAKEVREELDKIRDKRVEIVTVRRSKAVADGALFGRFAAGGFGQPQVRPFQGAAGVQWGEQGSGPWEAFISGAPQKRDRSLAIWREVGRRLLGGFTAEDVLAQFASGGIAEPTHQGRTLSEWERELRTPLELTRLRIQIRDLRADLTEREAYYTGKGRSRKKRSRLKLRGLDRTEAQQELAETRAEYALALEAKKLNESKQGTIEAQIAAYEAQQDAAERAQESASAAEQASQRWQQMYMTGSSAADLLANMQAGAHGIAGFNDLLGRLDSAGLSDQMMGWLWDQGPSASDIAKQILDGGLVSSFNAISGNLSKAADAAGQSQATGSWATSPVLTNVNLPSYVTSGAAGTAGSVTVTKAPVFHVTNPDPYAAATVINQQLRYL